ncbi:hypothetical protein, partial [Burkholderia gladioli]|uniref:hypothetical protein n=1 Tax=Burkholderia gladioli TaxID=28095 RepID=UPI003FEF29C5
QRHGTDRSQYEIALHLAPPGLSLVCGGQLPVGRFICLPARIAGGWLPIASPVPCSGTGDAPVTALAARTAPPVDPVYRVGHGCRDRLMPGRRDAGGRLAGVAR